MDAILALLNRLAAAANAVTAATDATRAAAQADLDAVQAELDTALAALTAEELGEIDAALRAQMTEASATAPRTADVVAQMQTIRDGILAVGAETTRRDEEQATLDAQAAEILAEVTPPAEESETVTPAEGEQTAETETPAEGEQTAETAEPVAASAAPRPRRAPLAALRAAQQPEHVPVAETHAVTLVASMGATGIVREGAQITDRRTLGALMRDAHRRLGQGSGGKEDRVVVASGTQTFRSDRVLGDDPAVNADRIEAARAEMYEQARAFLRQTPAAMVASGGFCGLTTPIYESPMISQRGRPVHNGFAISMQAPRAGIRHPVPLSLADIPVGNAEGDAVWLWDNDTDVLAQSDPNTVKPCWHIDCGDFTEELVQAIGICLEFGNLGQMSHPERFAQATDLADVAHDRVTETLLLDAIKAKSIKQTRARALGAAKDFFAALNLKAAQMRSVNRMDAGDSLTDSPLVWTGPDWLLEAFRVDILRTQFPGETSWDFSVERLMAHFRAAGVVPTFYVDTPTGAEQIPEFGDDGDPIPEFPTHAEWGLAVPGVHLVLEAPEINLGQVRDSVLNAKNNVRTFTETFQGHAMIGPPTAAAWVRQELCADGSVAAALDTTDICGTTAS